MNAPLDELLAHATEVLDGAAARFVDGIGAPSAVHKGGNDFATALDLELEKRITGELFDRTGIEVHGEEFGGPDLTRGTTWVLDPIDGTLNYSAGLPTAGILLALLQDGEPVLGLTWIPLARRTFAAAKGGPLRIDGQPVPPLEPARLADSLVAFGTVNMRRLALLGELSQRVGRMRVHGTTGLDLAYTAAGSLGAALVFGRKAWDNAPGVALVRAAGGVVTDLQGEPWTVTSTSVLAAAPGIHEEIMAVLSAQEVPTR